MIIGFSGKKGAGKDFIAGMFHQELFQRKILAKRIAFADSLKEGVAVMLEIPRYYLHTSAKDLYGFDVNSGQVKALKDVPDAVSIRKIMQAFGQSMKASLGENIFVNLAMNKITDHALITDVRFPNEVEAIKSKGGFIVKIINPEEKAEDQDISENALNNYKADFEIINYKKENSYDKEQKQIIYIIDQILNV
jgi:hypothetical protein